MQIPSGSYKCCMQAYPITFSGVPKLFNSAYSRAFFIQYKEDQVHLGNATVRCFHFLYFSRTQEVY